MIKTTRFLIMLLSLIFLALTIHDPHEPFGFEIAGDFNGDGREEHAKSGTVRQFYPEKTDRTDWMIRFSDTSLPEIMAGCCLTYLMVEGDLNGDKADEFSLYQKSANPDDCHFYITTYTFRDNSWKPLIGPFPVNRGCDNFPTLSLLNKVIKDKKGRVYFEVDTGGVVRKYRAF